MIRIVRAHKEQAELIAEIGRLSFLESHGNSASVEDVDHFILKTYTKEKISNEFENKNVQYHLLYFEGTVVGFSKITLNSSNKDIPNLNITKLDRLYLLKEFYGKNLGSKLIDFNIELSKKHNQNGIWLAVWVKNQRAIKFYSKIGFKIVGKYNFKISETHSNPNHIMFLHYK